MKSKYTHSTGKRRTSSARVRLIKGKSENLVNGMVIEKYFPGKVFEVLYKRPFELTDTWEKYHITAKVAGGGKKGQLDALVHGITKALAKEDSEKFRFNLKKAGLLTRDPRIRERRKVGTGGRARRAKQSPKR